MYLVKSLDADPKVQNAIRILRTLPWSLKLVYGFISDAFPIMGMRRKPYLVIGLVLNFLSFAAYTVFQGHDFVFLGICILIGKIGLIMMDVMVDTMVYLFRCITSSSLYMIFPGTYQSGRRAVKI